MKAKALAIFLIFLILFYPACTGKSGNEESKSGIEKVSESMETESKQTSQGIELSTFTTLSQLLSLKKPIKCEIEAKTGGEMENVKQRITYYILGENFRMDSEVIEEGMHAESMPKKATMIVRDNYVYTKLSSPIPGLDCAWLRFKPEESSSYSEGSGMQGFESGAAKYEAPENVKIDASWKCSYASFGEEMFSTQGKICDMHEIMQKIASSAMGMG